jgi:membrane protease YdiL (CAAX protease family)
VRLLSLTGGPDPGALKPRLSDLGAALIAFPGLLAAGFCVSRIAPFFTMIPVIPGAGAPGTPPQWLAAAAACIGTGYFEEGYFRLYLLSRFRDAGLTARKSVFLSVLLFSFCHVYEGFWGTLNAAAAGALLSLVFIRRRSFHGIAWAHGAYNILAYAMIRLFP